MAKFLPWGKTPQTIRPPRQRIVGVVRFSYPALSAFKRTPADDAGARRHLYDPERLERRFALFEALTLPSMIAQTDADFQLGFLIGDDFPAAYRARLETLLRDLPQAYLLAMPSAANFKATNLAFKAARLDGAELLTSFRLDDDDAMDRNFIARLRHQVTCLVPLSQGRPFAVSQNRGFFLEVGEGGGRIYDVQERTPPSCGAALVARIGSGATVYIQNHRDLAEKFNLFIDAETPAFIRAVHRDNDSEPHVAGASWTQTQEVVRRLVTENFPFSVDDLLRLKLPPSVPARL